MMGSLSPYQLLREETGLLVIDLQERLAAAMFEEEMQNVTANARRLIEGARVLGLPVWVTEQYPKGIGPTLETIAEVLPEDCTPVAKVDFSCASVPAVFDAISSSGCKQLIVCGMEAHICVFQTVRDFIGQGWQVHVPMDAVLSRSDENLDVGLNLIEQVGAVVTSTETILFDLLQKAGSPEFKAISALVK